MQSHGPLHGFHRVGPPVSLGDPLHGPHPCSDGEVRNAGVAGWVGRCHEAVAAVAAGPQESHLPEWFFDPPLPLYTLVVNLTSSADHASLTMRLDLQDTGCVSKEIKYGVMLYGSVRGFQSCDQVCDMAWSMRKLMHGEKRHAEASYGSDPALEATPS
ncbi:hypothetical protein HaLaN_01985 [Haematococcus lacustris]|uniref:Uncharacterized protein n=1 Tax=Haematococcus lacustris TaxID=44745 RepID=A0A699YCV9_HAELA|nr:hypothetical protein HaLaN_01985 [Haematococcus lacustris]